MQDLKNRLYISNGGRVVCVPHGGSYLRSAYERSPERAQYSTPLDHWMRVDTDMIVLWVDETGRPPKCEDCR